MQFADLMASILPETGVLWKWGLVFIVLAYFCGSIPFGYLAGKCKGIDLREHGSGNIGATNAIRVLGKKWGIPVFICDFCKGYLPVWVAASFLPQDVSFDLRSTMIVLTGVFAVLGHTYTCWLKFKGGKGVATAAGVLTALVPGAAAVVILVWLVVFLLTRYVSLSSILAAFCFPFVTLYRFHYFSSSPAPEGSLPYVVFSIVIGLLVILKHLSNIKRLLAGTESRAFSKKNHTSPSEQ